MPVKKVSLALYRALRQIHARTMVWRQLFKERGKRASASTDLALRRTIRGEAQGRHPQKICVFAHYDRDGIVDPYVLYYLVALRDAGFGIVFVSNADEISDDGIKALLPLCREILLRENRGYDFGAWKAGLSRLADLDKLEALLLVNDSVYGPFAPLSPILSRMRKKGVDFWGITSSNDLGAHLQSYFIHFDKAVLQSSVFRRFWSDLPLYDHKHCVIHAGEHGLGKTLQGAGFRMGALVSYDELRQIEPETYQMARLHDPTGWVNPSRHLWKELLREGGSPFLKADIVRDGFAKADGPDGWRQVIEGLSDYDTGLIERHADRMNK